MLYDCQFIWEKVVKFESHVGLFFVTTSFNNGIKNVILGNILYAQKKTK